MSEFDADKLYSIVAYGAAGGAVIGGFLLTLLGLRRRRGGENGDDAVSRYDIERSRREIDEVARLDRRELHRRVDEARSEFVMEVRRVEGIVGENVRHSDDRLRALDSAVAAIAQRIPTDLDGRLRVIEQQIVSIRRRPIRE